MSSLNQFQTALTAQFLSFAGTHTDTVQPSCQGLGPAVSQLEKQIKIPRSSTMQVKELLFYRYQIGYHSQQLLLMAVTPIMSSWPYP